MSRKIILWLALPCAVVAGIFVCGISGIRMHGRNDNTSVSAQHRSLPYAPPHPPSVLTDVGKQTDYLALHYWDAFPMADTTYIGTEEITEQALADYLHILVRASPEATAQGFNILLDKAIEGDMRMFAHFSELLEHYLYEPDSPMRNDQWYIGILRHIIASPQVGGIYKIRPKAQLEMALKNSPGNTASDFAYLLYDGTEGSLYTVREEYTLLVFYDPDCPGCQTTIRYISGSPALISSTRHRQLSVLAVYTGNNTELWYRHKGELPGNWTVCRDAGGCITSGRLYDLRAVPSLYLLGRDKRVILKDATFAAVEEWLESQAPR